MQREQRREAQVHLVGGALGPKLLTHVKCQTCGKKYNNKSRREYTKNIIIYNKVI